MLISFLLWILFTTVKIPKGICSQILNSLAVLNLSFIFFPLLSVFSSDLNWIGLSLAPFLQLCAMSFGGIREVGQHHWPKPPPNKEGQTQFGWHGQNMFSPRLPVSAERTGGRGRSTSQRNNLASLMWKGYVINSSICSLLTWGFQRASCWEGRAGHNALACHNIEKNSKRGKKDHQMLYCLCRFPHN